MDYLRLFQFIDKVSETLVAGARMNCYVIHRQIVGLHPVIFFHAEVQTQNDNFQSNKCVIN